MPPRSASSPVRGPRRLALALLAASLALSASPPPLGAENERLVDRVLATVDDDPILASDVEQAIGVGLEARRAGENDRALRRRVLDRLIEQRLRFHEVDRFGFTEVPVEEIEAQLEAIRSRFADAAAFRARLAALALTEESLRQLVVRQLMTMAYVEERVGARVFVSLEDIRSYYDDVLLPEMRKAAAPLPELEEVRERIRRVLREQRLNDEIDRWTAQLRAAADVADHFDAEAVDLPPVRFEIRR